MKTDVHLMLTADGSHTAFSQQFGKAYHSVHGAIQESQRVFIELGLWPTLDRFQQEDIRVFEMGFGTGLNALLTAHEALIRQRSVQYTAVEAFPMPVDDALQLNYDDQLGTAYVAKLHTAPWNEPAIINPYFTLTKRVSDLLTDVYPANYFHLIYYDAFAPTAQPELWESAIFQKMANLLVPGGMLTTYCSRSYVQRNLRASGFVVEKHAGPWGKREVLRAIR